MRRYTTALHVKNTYNLIMEIILLYVEVVNEFNWAYYQLFLGDFFQNLFKNIHVSLIAGLHQRFFSYRNILIPLYGALQICKDIIIIIVIVIVVVVFVLDRVLMFLYHLHRVRLFYWATDCNSYYKKINHNYIQSNKSSL